MCLSLNIILLSKKCYQTMIWHSGSVTNKHFGDCYLNSNNRWWEYLATCSWRASQESGLSAATTRSVEIGESRSPANIKEVSHGKEQVLVVAKSTSPSFQSRRHLQVLISNRVLYWQRTSVIILTYARISHIFFVIRYKMTILYLLRHPAYRSRIASQNNIGTANCKPVVVADYVFCRFNLYCSFVFYLIDFVVVYFKSASLAELISICDT